MLENKENISAGNALEGQEVQGQQAVEGSGEQSQESSDFFLDEEGSLQGNFNDWVGEKDDTTPTQEAETGEKEPSAEENGNGQEANYYAPEELAQLELHEVDFNRLSPELRPYYEALLKQTVAEKTTQPQSSEQTTQPQDPLDAIKEEAKKRVIQRFGEFDELNPEHITALAFEASRLSNEYQKQEVLQRKFQELKSSEPYFDHIDRYAQEKLLELPAKEYLKLAKALQEKDANVVLPFWEKCRREFYEQKLGKSLGTTNTQTKQTQTQAPVQGKKPPTLEGAGLGQVDTQSQIKPRDFARMSEDEQAAALIRMGLV